MGPVCVRCVALLVLAILWAGSAGARAESGRGSLVIAGGALKADTAEVWSRIVALAGGAGAPIAVFGSASADPVGSSDDVIAILRRYGARPYFVPVATELAGSDYRRAAADRRNVAAVARARGVYFTGGDQSRITRALVDRRGRRTPVLAAIWRVFERGGVVAGSSAGAAIMSRTMFYEPAPIPDLLARGARQGTDIAPGLGFVGPQLFVDQHVLARGRFARMVPAMMAAGYRIGLGVDEDTAAEVSPDGRVTILGRSGAVLIRLDAACCTMTSNGLRVANGRIGLLRPGDVHDLPSGTSEAAATKHRVERRATGASDGDVDRHDILDANALVALIDDLAGRDLAHALGRTRGFVFDFRRGEETRVFAPDAAGTDGYSVFDLAFDVEPDASPSSGP